MNCTKYDCHCGPRVQEAEAHGQPGSIVEVCEAWFKADQRRVVKGFLDSANEIKIAPPPPEDLNLQELDMECKYGCNEAEYDLKCARHAGVGTALPTSFVTKDSGERQEFSTGMVRDIQTDKPRYDLLDKSMLRRWADLMARGAAKYGENNWRKAETDEELRRFESSLLRHTFQLLDGDRTEDHGAAICFNVAGYEMVLEKLRAK